MKPTIVNVTDELNWLKDHSFIWRYEDSFHYFIKTDTWWIGVKSLMNGEIYTKEITFVVLTNDDWVFLDVYYSGSLKDCLEWCNKQRPNSFLYYGVECDM